MSSRGQTDAQETVCAVIVTYNRCELLAESLAAVLGQTRPPDSVLVVDNASDDGTAAMLADRFSEVGVLALASNEGSSGGFHRGIKQAHRAGYDLIWVMDDDTVPETDALETLLRGREGCPDQCALIASKVTWTDGRLHPMNVPWLSWKDTERLIGSVESNRGLLPLRATTFVSLLLPRSTVDRHGLPETRYFMWSDDIEYTARILRDDVGYMATRSVVVHRTPSPHTALSSSGERYYFHVRNTIYMLRGSSWSRLERASYFRNYLRSILAFLRRERFRPRALGIVARGVHDGLRPPADPAGPYLRR